MNSLSEDISFDFKSPAVPEIVFEDCPPTAPASKPASRPTATPRQQAKVPPRESIQPSRGNRPVESKRNDPANSAGLIAREPPHSAEAEEYLLSCCLLDGADTLDRCIASKLPVQAFYTHANQIIYKSLWNQFRERGTVSIEVLIEELNQQQQLSAVGGVPYLMQVSARIPTTANAITFLEKVRDLYLLRELIKVSTRTVEQCYGYQGGLQELVQDVGQDFDSIRDSAAGVDSFDKISKPLADFSFPIDDTTILLGPQNRYICRGGKLVIVAPSGTGKSVTAYQAAACWSVGRPFLGLASSGVLKSLIIQAEDDEGDIGEVKESLSQAMGFDESTTAQFRENIRIVRDDTHTGMNFLPALRAYVRAWPADLVWINPLVNFCPGMSEERVLSEFLCGLNAINENHAFAYVVTHHTSKPPASKDGEARQAAKSPYARQYSAFGSSILTNWARAIINLEAVANDDSGRQFRFNFDKRGRRAGIKEEGEGGHLETVTRIRARHSSREVTVKDKKFPMLLWELDEAATNAEESSRAKASEDGKRGGRPPKRNHAAFLDAARLKFPTEDTAVSWNVLTAVQENIEPLGKTTMAEMVRQLVEEKLIRQRKDGLYWVPIPAESSPYDSKPVSHETWYGRNDESPWPVEPPADLRLE